MYTLYCIIQIPNNEYELWYNYNICISYSYNVIDKFLINNQHDTAKGIVLMSPVVRPDENGTSIWGAHSFSFHYAKWVAVPVRNYCCKKWVSESLKASLDMSKLKSVNGIPSYLNFYSCTTSQSPRSIGI